MIRMKIFYFLLLSLLLSMQAYAKESSISEEDSLATYVEKFVRYQQDGDVDKAIYYGCKVKDIWDRNNWEKDSLYCNLVYALSGLHESIGEYDKSGSLLKPLLPIIREIYGENSIEEASIVNSLALSQSYLGNYSEAIRLENEYMEKQKIILGTECPDYANSLLFLAYNYSCLCNYSEAIRLQERAVEILKRVVGSVHPDYAKSLSDLAANYYNIGNYSKAIQLETEALEIRKEVLGTSHPEYAASLAHIANYYSLLGKYTDAIHYGNEAMAIRKNVVGIEHPDYAASLNDLAGFYSKQGNYSEAIRLATEALVIRKKVLGVESLDYAQSLDELAGYYFQLGNYSEAIRLCNMGLDVRKKALGPMHPEYGKSLHNLSGFYSGLGNYSEAIRLGTEALAITKAVLGTDHPSYVASLSNLALCYSKLGDYSSAIWLGTEAVEITKKNWGTMYPAYATYLDDLANFHHDLGNYDEAVRLSTESLEITEKLHGKEHPYFAATLSNLARYYSKQGYYTEAIRLVTGALEIEKKVLGTEHPDYATSLNNLACYYSDMGNYSEAIRLGTEALGIRTKVLGTEHPDYAASLNNIANFYSFLGNYSESILLFTKTLDINRKILGTEHQNYTTSLNNLSLVYSDLGNYTSAYSYLEEAVDISQKNIISNFSDLPSELRESLWEKEYATMFNKRFPSVVFRYKTSESVPQLYNKTALFSKGILLNTNIAIRKLILESGDTELISRYDALAANKSIYEKQLEKPISERFLDMDSLRSVIQQQEMQLARDSKAYGDYAKNLRLNWKDVQQQLGDQDIAIEFLDFPVYDTDSIMYVALTLRKGYEYPHMVPLFENRQLKGVSSSIYYTSASLYNLVWKPLEEELSGVKDIYFSPSGELHRIGIEYIPMSKTENICDRYTLHRLSSTRQLAAIQDETKGEKTVLYGGLRYDGKSGDGAQNSVNSTERRSLFIPQYANVDTLGLRGSYEYLPGTKDEADQIASNLKSHSIPYSYYEGNDGTEESFKGLDGTKPRLLHIATHGFYLTEQDALRTDFARPLMLEEDRHAYHEDKPMTRSGLLLSGCQAALDHQELPAGAEDGILTAQEISKLDLRGLDLVVLSACQTGLGDITSGEGVFGLQRGFKQAGARTIIMSLWKVSDSATRQLMTSFYGHYLSGKSKEQAFRMAQDGLRKQGMPNQKKPDWAAFVMLDGIL